jgi:hypothetical protein
MLFKDMLDPILSELYTWIISSFTEGEGAYEYLEYISQLEQVAVALSASQRKDSIELAHQNETKNESGASLGISSSPNLDLKGSRTSSGTTSSKETYQVTYQEKIHFPDLHVHLSGLLDEMRHHGQALPSVWLQRKAGARQHP